MLCISYQRDLTLHTKLVPVVVWMEKRFMYCLRLRFRPKTLSPAAPTLYSIETEIDCALIPKLTLIL